MGGNELSSVQNVEFIVDSITAFGGEPFLKMLSGSDNGASIG